MANLKEARVPDIGGYDDVPVIEVLVAVGDTVAQDQGLITLESDKATMEVPAPFAGVVRELKVKVGDTLSEGGVVAMIEAADEAAPADKPAAKAEAAPARAEPAAGTKTTPAVETGTQVEPVAVPKQADQIAQASIERADAASAAAPMGAGLPPVRFDAEALHARQGALREPRRAPVRARTGRRPGAGQRLASAAAASARKTCSSSSRARCRAARRGGAAAAAGGGLHSVAVAEGRLLQVRRDRDARARRASRRSPAPTSRATGR